MGGEGSIAGMITSLKNNSKLLCNKMPYFDRNKKISHFKRTRSRLKDLHKFSEEERIVFINKLRKQKKGEDTQKVVLFLLLLGLFIGTGIILFS